MRTQRRNVLISALFVVFGGPGFVLVYIPFWMTRFRVPAAEAGWQILPACALNLLGLAPLFESIVRFVRVGRGTLVPAAPTERLVVSGLYRYVRNPMYAGVLTCVGGEAILFRSHSMAVYLACGWLATHLFVCLYEEPTLARRHPEDYPRYKRDVPRWLPRFTPWKGAAE